MNSLTIRELGNRTAEVLRRVEGGEEIEILKGGRPVARIVPLARRRQWISAAEIVQELDRLGPDVSGQREELREVLPGTTDDLRW
ncbi:type II toxin-antitoxin system Phd/YefM family antitoxin [Nocardia sp. NPDC060256]|uniref:type II toxin-antitoxin system Phd/YefM family antitoxin n=1 Tax=unclassified Nocardia TaxID=2637762 RepID=UPI00365E3069